MLETKFYHGRRQQKEEVCRVSVQVISGAPWLAEGSDRVRLGVLGPHSGLFEGAQNSFFWGKPSTNYLAAN